MKTLFSGLTAILLLSTQPAWAGLMFSQQFKASTIDAGSHTELIFTIENDSAATASTDIQFVNVLPAGVVASGRELYNSCDGQAQVDAAGSTLTLTGGRLPAGKSCLLRVDVTAAAAGIYTSTSGDLTDNAANYGVSSDTLTVADDGLDFRLDVDPPSAELGQRVRVTYHLEDKAPGGFISYLAFSHVLNGLTPVDVGSYDLSGSCTGVDIGMDDSHVDFSLQLFQDEGVCEVSVDMKVISSGELYQKTSALVYTLNGQSLTRGYAADLVTVSPRQFNLIKSVQNNRIVPGETVEVSYRLTNTSRTEPLYDIAFVDDYAASLAGLVAGGTPLNNVCGTGSVVTGGGQLNLSGGSLAPGAECEFTVGVQVPAGTVEGRYTSSVQASAETATGSVLSAVVEEPVIVAAPPLVDISLSQSLITDEVEVTYTLTNASTEYVLENFTLTDLYPSFVTLGEVKAGSNSCGSSPAFYLSNNDVYTLVFNEVNPLAAGASCEFTLVMQIAGGGSELFEGQMEDVPGGWVNNQLRPARVERERGRILRAPVVQLGLSSDRVLPGEPFDVSVVVSNGSGEPNDQDFYPTYTDLEMMFDGAGLIDLLSMTESCADATTTGGMISIPGLQPGESCALTLRAVATAAAAGQIASVSLTGISAQTEGQVVSALDRSKSLNISGLSVETLIQPSAVTAGQSAMVVLNLHNVSSTDTIEQILYLDSTSGHELPFSFAAVNTADVCGSGSQLLSTGPMLSITNLQLAPGESCQIPVEIQVAGGAPSGLYRLMNRNLSYTEAGSNLTVNNAGGTLEVLTGSLTSDISEERNLTEQNPDDDPFDTATEQLAGDLNGDGTADAVQSFIASTINPLTGRPVGLEVDPACTINSFEMVAADSVGPVESGTSFPEGMARFSISCTQSVVTLYLPGANFSGNQLVRKYGPVAPDFGGDSEWYEPLGSQIDAGAQKIRFVLTDNALGDADPTVGVILDPVGLASQPGRQINHRAIPIGGMGWLALLSVLLLIFGVAHSKRRTVRI